MALLSDEQFFATPSPKATDKPKPVLSDAEFLGTPDDFEKSIRADASPTGVAKAAVRDVVGYGAGLFGQIEDMLASTPRLAALPGMAGVAGTAAAKGESSKGVAGATLAYQEQFLPGWSQGAFGKIAEALGPNAKSYYENNGLAKFMEKFGEHVTKGSDKIEEKSGIPAELTQLLVNSAMDALGGLGTIKGVKSGIAARETAAKAKVMERQFRPVETPAPVVAAPVEPLANHEPATITADLINQTTGVKTPAEIAAWRKARQADVKAAFKDVGTADQLAALANERMESSAWELIKDAEKHGRTDPNAANKVDWTDVNDIIQKPGHLRTPEEMIRVRQYARNLGGNKLRGAVDPELLPYLFLAGAIGPAAYKAYVLWKRSQEAGEENDPEMRPPQDPEPLPDQNWRTYLATGGAAAMGAIKGKGGMWHPEAVERLAKPLAQAATGLREAMGGLREYREIDAAGNLKPEYKAEMATMEWSDKAVRNWLNKHAGTETDPLKDVEVPFGEGTKRWEELTDAAIRSTPAKELVGKHGGQAPFEGSDKIPPDEVVWRLSQNARPEGERAFALNPLTSYLSHVGDYLREHVSPEKLQQYNLVQAVKETAQWDKELAKNMEKVRAAEKTVSPIYKEYPEGMYWQQLTKPGQFARESDQMGHSVRGYEPPKQYRAAPGWENTDAIQDPHPDWIEASGDSGHPSYGLGGWEAIKRGDAKVYSLRDAKGKSHVTVEADFGLKGVSGDTLREAGRDDLWQGYLQQRAGGLGLMEFLKEKAPDVYESLVEKPHITQIKGKQNRAPTSDYLPYVQDFVKSGKWGEVGDLENTGLIPLHELDLPYRGSQGYKIPAGQQYFTPEEVAKIKGQNSERGSVDPKLLLTLAATAVGATAGAALSKDNPIISAVLGGLAAGALTKLSPRKAAQTVKSIFASDTRIRINDLANTHDADIAQAGRAIWQQQRGIAEAVPKVEDRNAITHAIQQNKVGTLPRPLQEAARTAKAFFTQMAEAGQSSGVLKGLIDNYVTNLWDLTGKNKDTWEAILTKAGGPSMSPESRFALKRSITDLETGKRMGLIPRTEDVAEIMGIYGNSLARSMANKKMLTALREETVPGDTQKLLLPSTKAPHSYVVIDHPQMNGLRVHPDIAPSMKFIFDNSDPGVVARGLEGLNTAIKRSAVSFSLFHAKALADANIGAYGMLKGIPKTVQAIGQAALPKLFGQNAFLKQLREGGVGDLVDKALTSGLKISMEKGKLADEDIGGSFYSGLKLAQQGLDSIIPGAGLPVAAITKVNHLVDTFMWERLHAGMKLGVFADKLEVLRNADAKAAAREGRAPRAEAELAAQASSFTNDIFGGLNWRRLAEEANTKWGRDITTAAYSPKGRRVMQLLMFAPDWTLSTARAATRTLGKLAGYESGSGLRGLLEPKNATDLHRQYMIRSAMYYAIVGDGINYALSGHHLWDNKDPTMIDMGDGRTMQWSKHSMEPVHWVTKPGQQALNKLGFLPKEVANQLLGTEYLSAAGRAPKMDTSVAGRLKHAGSSTLPIAAQQAFGGNATEGSGVAGFFGAPIYGRTHAEAARRKEERRQKAIQKRIENRGF